MTNKKIIKDFKPKLKIHALYRVNGIKLAHYRHCAKLSQLDLALEAEIEQRTVSLIETGHIRQCHGATLCMIARVLKIKAIDLIIDFKHM
jgi:DNA-binding XRE family transcriptional regulator